MRFFFNRKSSSVNGTEHTVDATQEEADESVEIEKEIAAVIALAIHKYVAEVREYENTVLTIQQVIRPYSPWSSKIYGLRQQPMRVPGIRTRIR